jgi:hypothetical protein
LPVLTTLQTKQNIKSDASSLLPFWFYLVRQGQTSYVLRKLFLRKSLTSLARSLNCWDVVSDIPTKTLADAAKEHGYEGPAALAAALTTERQIVSRQIVTKWWNGQTINPQWTETLMRVFPLSVLVCVLNTQAPRRSRGRPRASSRDKWAINRAADVARSKQKPKLAKRIEALIT